MKRLEDVVEFHGHICPGLVLGYRVSMFALKELWGRADDEELVAIAENDSCAVDAIQVMTGCTFGKGNLLFRDYGKQVYTFIKRPSRNRVTMTGDGIRISVKWKSPEETEEEKKMWERYMKGDRSDKVLKAVHNIKSKKIDAILHAKDKELFKVLKGKVNLPEEARIYPSIRCALCGEKVMEPRARVKDGKVVCIPCCKGREIKIM
ncbi:MAG: FmdE family protein [Nitrospirota bacterium]